MRRTLAVAGLTMLLMAVALPVLAHGGGEEGVAVEPSDVTAGNSVVFTGEGLEENSDRVLVLVGGDLSVQLGSVTTSAEGTFQVELTIPDYLPSGLYQLQAIGDETLFADVNVTAAAGEPGASGAPAASETLTPPTYSPAELAGMAVAVLLLGLFGGWLVWRAETISGSHEPFEG